MAGVVQDVLLTAFYLAMSEKHVLQTFLLSVAVTMAGYGVFYFLVLSPEFFWYLLSYAIGGGLGSAVVVWYKKKYKEETTDESTIHNNNIDSSGTANHRSNPERYFPDYRQ